MARTRDPVGRGVRQLLDFSQHASILFLSLVEVLRKRQEQRPQGAQ